MNDFYENITYGGVDLLPATTTYPMGIIGSVTVNSGEQLERMIEQLSINLMDAKVGKFILRPTYIEIERVIFNDPATIVFWQDGTKTVVKATQGETFNPYLGVVMCYLKRVLGENEYAAKKRMFNKAVKEFMPKEEPKEEVEETEEV